MDTMKRVNAAQLRVPFEPVRPWLERELARREDVGGKLNRGVPWLVEELTGVHNTHVHTYIRRGLTLGMADEIAIALDLHPCLIWPEWATMQIDDDIDWAEAPVEFKDSVVRKAHATGRRLGAGSGWRLGA